jgi:hypothetical protein
MLAKADLRVSVALVQVTELERAKLLQPTNAKFTYNNAALQLGRAGACDSLQKLIVCSLNHFCTDN